jgi:hypothetical protein
MITVVLLVGLVAAFFIAFGRSGSAERPPLRELTARQLGTALLDGIVTFSRLHEQRRGTRPTTGGAHRPDRSLVDYGHRLP